MHLLCKLTLAAPLLALTMPLMAGVLVSSPADGSTVTRPVHYMASATTTTCSKGVASMGVYVDSKLIDVVDGSKLNVSLPVAPGKHETVVEEWDRCGGATLTKLAIAVVQLSPRSAATPTFSLASGTYTSAKSVTLSDATAGATIYYTTNGTTPTTSSTQYSDAISVTASETIEAIAVAKGYIDSGLASADYVIGGSYYLAPAEDGGNDANDGLSPDAPWRSPDHPLKCGDVITAASGTYAPGTFEGTFGTVTGTGHCFAILKCATFDTCFSIGTGNDPTNGLIWVSKSHWAVMGFEVRNPSATSADSSCFKASPLRAATITDVAFINDIANGCGLGGFATAPYYAGGSYGVDYFIMIADIAYNAAQTKAQCANGISIWKPVNYDTLPGTHTYIAQYFGWGNVEPRVCGGTAATDGEGVIFDTFSAFGYTGQTALEDSLTVFNGSHGIEVWENASTPIFIKNNTTYANNGGPGLDEAFCGEIDVASAARIVGSTQVSNNIAQTSSATGCGSNPNYAYFAANVNSTNVVNDNVGYSESDYNTLCDNTCTGFSFGPNNAFGTDPDFASAPTRVPAAPSCRSSFSAIACMAPMIADFVPRATGMSSYGYQRPSSTPNSDPLFPRWLCQYSNQLNGLVTMGCS
jgi:Chitobiase/beta-hexosaminidase C-terminal domain